MNEPVSRPELPDRLSIDPRSPHHVAAVFAHGIGIRFNGKERVDVEEYCISEGWIKVPAGKAVNRKGQPLMLQLWCASAIGSKPRVRRIATPGSYPSTCTDDESENSWTSYFAMVARQTIMVR